MKKLSKKEKEVVDEMYAFIEICLFTVSDKLGENWKTKDLAAATGLSISTVYRIINRIPVRPQFMTIQKIGKFVGFSLVEGRMKVNPKVHRA